MRMGHIDVKLRLPRGRPRNITGRLEDSKRPVCRSSRFHPPSSMVSLQSIQGIPVTQGKKLEILPAGHILSPLAWTGSHTPDTRPSPRLTLGKEVQAVMQTVGPEKVCKTLQKWLVLKSMMRFRNQPKTPLVIPLYSTADERQVRSFKHTL